ncbi:MAG: hypothetical protein K5769_02690 [Pseudobutyrivibrio sp.]|nr:hypothetical protein [Pseudobutyrivibrio sp.]
MKEEVYKVHKYSVGYKVDKQLLISLQEIFNAYNEENNISIIVDCSNNTKYIFDSIDECFDFFETKPYRIIKMSIKVSFGQTMDGNKIEMVFNNSRFPSIEISFHFDNGDGYVLIKNKIETCLNNFKLSYRILSKIPLIACASTLAFVAICVYTSYKNIIFPTCIQYTIWAIWAAAIVISPFCFVSSKRNLFPCVEFWIGQNEIVEAKNTRIRNFILVTIGAGIFIGVMVNCISSFLF